MGLRLSFKICTVGEPGVGKTSLIIRYIENKFKENYIPTLGVDFLTKKIKVGEKNTDVTLIIWDIGGGAKWKDRINLYMKGADGVLIIYDITRRKSFNNLEYWINQVTKYSGRVPYLIVGNKKDLDDLRKVTLEEAMNYLRSKDDAPIIETSAKTGETVDVMFHRIAEKIIIEKAKKIK